MITLRRDQLEAVDKVRAAIRDQHKSILFQAQTGFGKTIVASYLAKGAEAKASPTIFGVHRQALVTQTSHTFDQFGIPHGIIAAGHRQRPDLPIQIASADTLRQPHNQWWLKGCKLLIPDEAHLWAAKHRASMIRTVRANGGVVVGLSATPARLDNKPLGDLFETLVTGPSVSWLMDHGHLSRYRAFVPVTADLRGVRKVMGDYVVSQLERALDKPAIIGDAVACFQKYLLGLRTLVFCFSRAHGQHVLDAYHAAGITAVYMDGDTPPAEREDAINAFADGEANALISVNLCTEGFDLSAQVGRDVPVEAVQLLRPTQSLALAKQMIGRALRKKAQPALIVDQAGILAAHGLPDEDIVWDLTKAVDPAKRTLPPMSTCTNCFFMGRPFVVCPECGAARDKKPRLVESRSGELAELDLEAARRHRLAEQDSCKSVDELVRLGKARGYSHPEQWAGHILRARAAKTRQRAAADMGRRGADRRQEALF